MKAGSVADAESVLGGLEIPKVERKFDFKPDNFLGGGNRQCPKPIQIRTRYLNTQIDYDAVCRILDSVRGIVIVLFTVGAAYIVLKGLK